MLIDDRAGSRDLIGYSPLTSTSELTRLDSGDALITGNGPNDSVLLIGVELKTISDLLSSTATGRLQATQLPAMLKHYDISYLLYYGHYRSGRKGELQTYRYTKRRKRYEWRSIPISRSRLIPYSYLDSFLLTLSAVGVRLKHVESITHAALWLGILEKWWSKPWDKHRALHTFDNSSTISLLPGLDPDVLQRARVAQQLPGVGFERAVAAARHFSSIRDMMNATAEQWEEIEGIGKVVAKAVERAIR